MNSEYDIGETGEYIYLIQERESIRCKDNIYKIGKTKQKPMKRMSAYPTGSKLWITVIVNNSTEAEKDLLKIFREKFKQIENIGAEYFYGNPVEMIYEIVKYQREHFSVNVNDNVNDGDGVDDDAKTVDENKDEVNSENITNEKLSSSTSSSSSEDCDINEEVKDSPQPQPQPSPSEEDIKNVIKTIRKPISLSRYTQILAESVSNIRCSKKCSANIHLQYNDSNVFYVKCIDLISPNKSITQTVDLSTLSTDIDEDITKIELNQYHMTKFNKIKVKNLMYYKINVCSFELKKFKYITYYKTVILPENE